ncbi:hypothetical protein KC573_02695, partial [candidate division WWE3 bacterium]|nr:hypothetical protein [candidate division WWE3 bacterium]
MTDLTAFITYYVTLLLLGISMFPLASYIFSRFLDRGWILSKTIAIMLLSYTVWFLGIQEILSFTRPHVVLIWIVLTLAVWGVYLLKTDFVFPSLVDRSIRELWNSLRNNELLRVIIIEESIFLIMFGTWTYVRAYSPAIQGLEKFMDYGFMNSILRAEYFPPLDHFFAAEPINYYYFGHLIAAVVTKLSAVPSVIAYNLQIAFLFAITFSSSFSIGITLIARSIEKKFGYLVFTAGLLSGLFTAVIGNLHAALNITDYKTYWYATATRLIPFTINEFPIYSFVVADLHGHVSNIPHALLIIALYTQFILLYKQNNRIFKTVLKKAILTLVLLTFAIGISYATNAWDFPIYLVLGGLATLYFVSDNAKNTPRRNTLFEILKTTAVIVLPVFIGSILIMWPYWQTVAPISEGIGIVRDLSPIGLVLILWGMYFFLAGSFIVFIYQSQLTNWFQSLLTSKTKEQKETAKKHITPHTIDFFVLILIITALLLIIIPEIIYVKDIYPQHYRANTMFKLYYAAWLMLSIATAYSFVRMTDAIKQRVRNTGWIANLLVQYILIAATLAYPYFAINSATGSFKLWKGLDGSQFIDILYPEDAKAIDWMNAT